MVIDEQHVKKLTEGNGQNLQFNFIIFFCFDVIKFLKPVFHAWSSAHFVDNNQNSEKFVFLIIAVVFFCLKFLL